MRVCVTGSAGMIGSHLVRSLCDEGHTVVAVDIEPLGAWQMIDGRAHNYELCDVSVFDNCVDVLRGCDQVWSLAFIMGGIQHIEEHSFDCIASSAVLTSTLRAALETGVQRVFVSGSACAYSSHHQQDPDGPALAEWMVEPVAPERGYGTAKWFDEEQCWAAYEQYGLECRVARYHNIYSGGPTTWTGGKEKAPAALCRKVAEAKLTGSGSYEIFGDGTATRSFCWIDDCLEGSKRLMESDWREPLNIGSSELVTINELADLVEDIAGVDLERKHNLDGATGVRARNSDNTLCREVLGWEPSTSLRTGMDQLYWWVEDQVREQLAHG